MLNKDDLKDVSELIESFRPKSTFFENEILVPGMIGRLEYVIQIYEEFKKISVDKEVAAHIDGALRAVVDPKLITLGVPAPKVGEQYLGSITKICDNEYINPIRNLLSKFPPDQVKGNIDLTTNFLNNACTLFQSIIGTKEKMFQYNLRAFLSITHTATGEAVSSPPTELTLILMPFQTRLDELINVARTSIQSIEAWGKQISEQKTKHVEIISHLSEVKAAAQQAKAAKINVWFQIAVIFFAISLVWFSQRANIYLEKRDLEDSVQTLRTEIDGYKKQQQTLLNQFNSAKRKK